MSGWSLVYDHFKPAQETLREALCTLGNGYFATRGAGCEAEAGEIHYPGTYAAGCYNRLETSIAGQTVENEDLVNLPNWLCLTFRIDEENWFNLMAVDILGYRQELDIKQGVLSRDVRFRDHQGRETRFTFRRLVHMHDRHLAAMECTLTPENWSGRIEVRSALDGRVLNTGVERYRQLNNKHLESLSRKTIGDDIVYLKVQTNQSEIRIAEAARTQVFCDGKPVNVERRIVDDPDYIGQDLLLDLTEGQPVTIEKIVALYTSRDNAISECGLDACNAIRRAERFQELYESHRLAWDHIWRRCEIGIEAPNEMPLILRLHVFHLLQTASTHVIDLDVGVPARGLHGEAYRGHVFWDELFIFPYLNLRIPEITRGLLRYRYRRLDEARRNAIKTGHHGANYPWQSGSNGREESQEVHLNPRSGRWVPDNTHLQRHVNVAIVYNIWQYFQVTRDMDFISFYGAEMICEIARFLSSITTFNEELERYEILGVMGPDEYHDAYPNANRPGLNNNSYTNVMTVWVMCRALEVLEILPHDRGQNLRERIGLSDEEIGRWDDIRHRMRIVFHKDGIISQFEGYEDLEEFDWDGYRQKYENIHRLDRILEAESDTPNRYKVSKQADVLMLFYLFSAEELTGIFQRLGYEFDPATIPDNIEYYCRRTSHGSTLSSVVHSWVLARSDRAGSWQLFTRALESDVADIQGGTTQEGIHLGAMAGTVDLVQRGYSGIEPREDVLWLNPSLPDDLRCLRLMIRYRGHPLDLEMTHEKLTIAMRECREGAVRIGFRDRTYDLSPEETREFRL